MIMHNNPIKLRYKNRLLQIKAKKSLNISNCIEYVIANKFNKICINPNLAKNNLGQNRTLKFLLRFHQKKAQNLKCYNHTLQEKGHEEINK